MIYVVSMHIIKIGSSRMHIMKIEHQNFCNRTPRYTKILGLIQLGKRLLKVLMK